MNYLLMYIIVPAVVSFLMQSILCRKVKKGILRHGALILSVIFIVIGAVILFTQSGDLFGGLGVIAAFLWFITAGCAIFGYGMAWLIFYMMSKGKDRERK